MTTEETLRPYDVWRLSFEYEDQPGVSKMRPVVVGAVDGECAAVLVVKVTGHGPRSEFPGEVRLSGWRDAGLDKPSVARCVEDARRAYRSICGSASLRASERRRCACCG